MSLIQAFDFFNNQLAVCQYTEINGMSYYIFSWKFWMYVGRSIIRVTPGAKRKITVARAKKLHTCKEQILPECLPQIRWFISILRCPLAALFQQAKHLWFWWFLAGVTIDDSSARHLNLKDKEKQKIVWDQGMTLDSIARGLYCYRQNQGHSDLEFVSWLSFNGVHVISCFGSWTPLKHFLCNFQGHYFGMIWGRYCCLLRTTTENQGCICSGKDTN